MAAPTHASQRWVALGVVYLSSLAFAISLQSVPPLLSFIIPDVKASYTDAGLLMSLFALPGIFVSIPAGMLADRYGQKVMGIVAFVLVLVGQAVFATGSSLLVMGIGRVIGGAGAMTLAILLPQFLAQWFIGREIGTAMGIFSTGMPVGTILSMNLLSLLAELLGWRGSAWASLVLPAVALAVFVVFFRAPPGKAVPSPARREGLFTGFRMAGGQIWIVGASWLLFNASMISLFTFTPDFLRGIGFSPAEAGLVASSTMWPALVLSPVVGFLVDRVGRRRTMIAAGGVLLMVLIALVPGAAGWMFALMLMIGVAQSFVPSPTISLAPEVVRRERLGLGFGVLSTCLNLGIIIGPAVVGWAKDVTGSFAASYGLMAVFAVLTSLVLIGLRPRPRKSEVSGP